MSLKVQLMADMKEAMIQKDKVRKDTIQMIRAGILQIEKDNKTTLDDNAILDVVSRELKTRREALAEIEKSGRTDLLENALREVDIVLGYMPAQMSESEVMDIVARAAEETGATSIKDMGKLMGKLMPLVKGKADGAMVQAIVKKQLG